MTARGNGTFVIGPGEGVALPLLDIIHKVAAGRFGGALAIVEWGLPPGAMIPPHTHSREDECNFVLEGELTCDVGGELGVAPAGAYVVKPRGIPHALANTGSHPLRVLEIHTPGAFARYYDEYAALVARGLGEEEHRRARAALGARYGVTWHDERIPEASVRFGLAPEPHRGADASELGARGSTSA